MFNFFRKDLRNITVYSPVNGKVMNLENVKDAMFADKLLGDGKAFEIEDEIIYSPCDGEVIVIAPTKHAYGIRANNGVEILIHIGLDTVNLKGKGFELLVQMKQKVKRGTPLVRIDKKLMQENGIDLTTPMIITNGDEFNIKFENEEGSVTLSSVIFNIMSL